MDVGLETEASKALVVLFIMALNYDNEPKPMENSTPPFKCMVNDTFGPTSSDNVDDCALMLLVSSCASVPFMNCHSLIVNRCICTCSELSTRETWTAFAVACGIVSL